MVSLFSEKTGYVSIGDEYDKKEPLDPRNVGLRGFVAQPGKKGNLPQATFDWKLRGQFIGLNEGDKYIDPGLLDREKQRESKEMCISKDPFRYTSYPQQSCGLGGYEGCFQKNVQHETEYDVTKKGELPVKTEGVPRNCVTNPSKKGTYGTPGTLLSNSMGGVNAGWAGLEYVCDPYDAPKRLEQKQKHLEKERIGDKVPFVVGTKRRAFFDETATVSMKYEFKSKEISQSSSLPHTHTHAHIHTPSSPDPPQCTVSPNPWHPTSHLPTRPHPRRRTTLGSRTTKARPASAACSAWTNGSSRPTGRTPLRSASRRRRTSVKRTDRSSERGNRCVVAALVFTTPPPPPACLPACLHYPEPHHTHSSPLPGVRLENTHDQIHRVWTTVLCVRWQVLTCEIERPHEGPIVFC